MQKPNLNKIIADNLDKTSHISKKAPASLPTGWIHQYKNGGQPCYECGGNVYKMGGGMFPEYHSYAPPRHAMGGQTGDPNQPYHPITNPDGYHPQNVLEKIKKLPNKNKPYEPSQMVNNAKAVLAGADLSTGFSSNPYVQAGNFLARLANSTGDAYTAARYAMDGQWGNAGVDAGEALLDLIPFRKGKNVINLSKTNGLPGTYNKLSKLDKSLNRGLKVAKGAASADDFIHSSMGKFLFGDPDSQVKYKDGGLLSRTVTCSSCGHSWKGVTGGLDPLTCHNCGGMIKMRHGGDISIPDLNPDTWLLQYKGGGPGDGIGGFFRNIFGGKGGRGSVACPGPVCGSGDIGGGGGLHIGDFLSKVGNGIGEGVSSIGHFLGDVGEGIFGSISSIGDGHRRRRKCDELGMDWDPITKRCKPRRSTTSDYGDENDFVSHSHGTPTGSYISPVAPASGIMGVGSPNDIVYNYISPEGNTQDNLMQRGQLYNGVPGGINDAMASTAKYGGEQWLTKYGPGGQATDGCGPGFSKSPLTGACIPNGWVAPSSTQAGPTKEAAAELNKKVGANIISTAVAQQRSNGTYIEPNQKQQATVGVSRSDEPWRKRQVENIKRDEAMKNSELAQSFAGLTPSGDINAGVIGANTFVNMTPGIGIIPASARLATFANSIGPNPSHAGESAYYSKDNSFGENALGALNLVGDVGMLGMGLPKSTPMPGVQQNGFGFGRGMLDKFNQWRTGIEPIRKPGTSFISKMEFPVQTAAKETPVVPKSNIQFNGPKLKSFEHIQDRWQKGMAAQEYMDDQLGALRARGQQWDQVAAMQGPDFHASQFLHPDMIEYHGTHAGRPLVEVKMPDGTSEHFYKSTGWANKAGTGANGTTGGQWQIYGQHMQAPAGVVTHNEIPSWFIKGHDYNTFYGSKTFDQMANGLDQVLMKKHGAGTVDELNHHLNFQNSFAPNDSYTPPHFKKGGWLKKYAPGGVTSPQTCYDSNGKVVPCKPGAHKTWIFTENPGITAPEEWLNGQTRENEVKNNEFTKEAEDFKNYLIKNQPGEDIEIYPTYKSNKDDRITTTSRGKTLNEILRGSDAKTRLAFLAHHGDNLYGSPAGNLGQKLQATTYDNCYLGSCFSGDIAASDEFKGLTNFHFRPGYGSSRESPDGRQGLTWLGINPNKNNQTGEEGINNAFYNTSYDIDALNNLYSQEQAIENNIVNLGRKNRNSKIPLEDKRNPFYKEYQNLLVQQKSLGSKYKNADVPRTVNPKKGREYDILNPTNGPHIGKGSTLWLGDMFDDTPKRTGLDNWNFSNRSFSENLPMRTGRPTHSLRQVLTPMEIREREVIPEQKKGGQINWTNRYK